MQEACGFCDITANFEPAVIDKKVNAARAAGKRPRKVAALLRSVGLLDLVKQVHGQAMSAFPSSTAFEKLSDVDRDVLKYLDEIYREDMHDTEKLIEQDG